MTAERHRVEFELLGQRLAIRSEATPEYVQELVAYIEARLKDVGDAGDAIRRLALATLYITDELFQVRHDREGLRDANARVDALVRLLDLHCEPQPKAPPNPRSA